MHSRHFYHNSFYTIRIFYHIYIHNFYKIYVSQLDNSSGFCPYFLINQSEQNMQKNTFRTSQKSKCCLWPETLSSAPAPARGQLTILKLNSGCGCSWSESILKSHSMFDFCQMNYKSVSWINWEALFIINQLCFGLFIFNF